MTIAIQIIQIVFQSVAILFMLTFMFIGIWSFIIFIKIYKNQKEKNYLLEKIANNLSGVNNLNTKDINEPPMEE